ncbi:chromosome segregation protein SMC [bacterium]|nr:chromosome segregation protein SMC [bacterium]MBU1983403.1 chromosome segregation protein SMC [bacterium]
MQLLSLNITGFKSFAKTTTLDFAPGVTAVVGPNGCGKSNIVDALRWVLGEQRSSVLRGERMENVIFNGTVIRKPAGAAEVKIVLDNSQGLLDTPFTEVEIARRLFRDGTSEYLLNGNVCRLRDITDLLHDSGMGPNLYTILELKMVEDILREDGEGRRMLFEEAAGVAKYKIRRRQALLKLKQTEEDLARLADVLTEVERQVASLKRQAMRARRYGEFAAQLRLTETALIYREYRRIKADLRPLEEALSKSSVATDSAQSAIRLEEARLLELRRSETDAEKEATELRRSLSEVVAQISGMEAEEAGLRARDQAARQTIERTRRERQLLADKRSLIEVRLSGVQENLAAVRAELDEAERRVSEAKARLSESERKLRDAETAAAEHSDKVDVLRRRFAQCREETARLAISHAGFVSRKELLAGELVSMSGECEELRTRLAELAVQADAAREKLSAKESETALAQAERTAVEQEIRRLEEVDRQLAGLIEAGRARLRLLATLEEKGPRSHSALRALRTNPIEGALDILGDTIEVEEPYRRALQVALGPAAYYFLVESTQAALIAMAMLRRENAGQTTFLAMDAFRVEPSMAVVPPEGTIGTALSVIKGNTRSSILEHFLGRVILVRDWQSALEYGEWAKTNRCTLITLGGEWIGNTGLLHGGSEESDVPADIGLRKQVEEIEQSLVEAERERETVGARAAAQRDKLDQVKRTLDELSRETAHLLVARTTLREQQVEWETRLTALGEREQSAQTRIETLAREITDCDRQSREAEVAVHAAETELHGIEQIGRAVGDAFSEVQRQAIADRETLHGFERERDAIHHKVELSQAEKERLEQDIHEMEANLRKADESAEQAANELVTFENRLKEIDALSIEKYRLRDERATAVDKMAVRLDEIRGRISEEEQRLRDLRESHAGELEGGRRIETEVARMRGELAAVVNSARAQWNLDLADENFEDIHPDLVEADASPESVQELKQKIERLGPINSLAVEEYATENARLEMMLAQRDDLLKAKRTLEDTIARINEKAQAQFLHTFEAVRGHFQRLFQEFFPAGEADLILSGTDLLEADITIWANPSGKRLKSLSLMSGGEKTMTANALLFALYQVKPSPFCVFDEVDAPLDDANIDRFTRMIRSHSENTQFILVTHNRRTMEIADNLYGVTMEEEGISKLVSVRLLSSVA